MSYQAIGLVIIFFIGCIYSCLQSFQMQPDSQHLPEQNKKTIPATAGFERASALLDYGQGEKASKMYQEILKTDLKEKSPRVAVDLNNEAVALYLSARNQSDASRVPELITLAGECLLTAQKSAQEMNLSQPQLAVLYNQAMLLDMIGEHGKANQILALASRKRRNLKPVLTNGLLP